MLHKDKQYLTKQYIDLGKSSNEIGKELEISHSTVVRWLRHFGVDVPKTRPRRKIVLVKCAYCQKPQKRSQCHISKNNFCGYECYHAWMVGNTQGENCNNWQGGITRISSRNLKTPEWRALKAKTLEKFPLCVVCGETDRLHVHHIKTRKLYPELVFDESNVITVCHKCHSKISGNEAAWEDYFTRLVCKSGELREPLNSNEHGNPQPSRPNVISIVGWKVQRLMGEDSLPINPTRVPDAKAMR